MKKSKVWPQILADGTTDSQIRDAYDRLAGASRGFEKATKLLNEADAEMWAVIAEVTGYRVLGQDTPDAVAMRHMVAFERLQRARHFHGLRHQDREAAMEKLRSVILAVRGLSE